MCSVRRGYLRLSLLLLTFLAITIHIAGCMPLRHDRVKRVIGGASVEKGQWPWLVVARAQVPVISLFGFSLAYREYRCSGSLISNRWVLSAAHCYVSANLVQTPKVEDPSDWKIMVGEVSLEHSLWDRLRSAVSGYTDSNWRIWEVKAQEIFVHPRYTERNNWPNDVALIKLSEALPIGPEDPDIGTVQLPRGVRRSWPGMRDECVLKGFGCTENDGPLSETALAATLPIIPPSECLFGRQLGSARLCAGFDASRSMGEVGICPGDSGGPLVCRHGNSWIQAGIASFTSRTRPGTFPGIFSKVSAYLRWIDDTMTKNGNTTELGMRTRLDRSGLFSSGSLP